MPVYNPVCRLSGFQRDVAGKERHFILLIQALPDHPGKLIQISRDGHRPGLAAERGQGIAVRFIGVDEMAQARLGRVIGKVIPDTAAGVAVQGFENTQNIRPAGE